MPNTIPPERFPPQLVSLGYEAHVINGVEVILPPLCDVPAGEFLMGTDPKRDGGDYDDEMPQHKVSLSAFQIARFPLTVAEYACFVRAEHAKVPERWERDGKVVDWQTQLRHLDHPVVMVSWHAVTGYADWLAQQSAQPWRLPTEAEWEKAARGTDGRIYPWGDGFDATRANTRDAGVSATTPVGSYPTGTSPFGAQDMAGNVWEWTNTLEMPYPYRPDDGREDRWSKGSRAMRGGSWLNASRDARTACRGFIIPIIDNETYGNRGARLARTILS